MTNSPEPTPPWWQTAVVYQIYPRSFQDTNRDGIGDLPGITRRLDYLAGTLGVDAVWISPFYPSPMNDFGYDVADYCDVDPIFGTLADFDALVAEAHARGLRIIIDWVPNHTSDRHPWFLASRSSRNDTKRAWYVWADPTEDGGPPNNWQAVFGGSAWEWDEATGQYYLHSFLPGQPDLNWRNPAVEAAMHDTLRFWLDRGVDGFRIDVAHYLMKDPELRDNRPAKQRSGDFKPLGAYDRWEHIHSKGHPDVHGVFRRLRQLVDAYDGDRILVGEIHEFDPERWAAYYGRDLDELHMPFDFSLLYAPWEAEAFRSKIAATEAALPPGAWPNHVLGNHDEVRLATRFGPERARVAAMLLLTLRGTPTLYYGDELGMTQVDIPPERARDPWGLRVPGQGRDGCRTPMPWRPGPGAGFCDPDVEPWLPFGPDRDRCNVEIERDDEGSLLSLYRRLLALRRDQPALQLGAYESVDIGRNVLAYLRIHGTDRILVALNFSGEAREIALPGEMELLVSTHGTPALPQLRRNEGFVARLR